MSEKDGCGSGCGGGCNNLTADERARVLALRQAGEEIMLCYGVDTPEVVALFFTRQGAERVCTRTLPLRPAA